MVTTQVSPTLYGLMTEEINYSYDGGLYAEMVRNRTFQHRGKNFNSWLPASRGNGEVEIDGGTDGPSAALNTSMKITVKIPAQNDEAGVANTGYWGMGVKPSTGYSGSFYAKVDAPQKARILFIADQTSEVVAEASESLNGQEWKQYQFKMTSNPKIDPSAPNHLEILFDHAGTVHLQLVSVMGPTFHNRPNGR